MLLAEATVVIDRPPEAILDWISDLERYRHADTKIGKVLEQRPDRVRYRGRLRGIPTLSDVNTVHLEPGRSLTFRGAPGRWTRRMLDFEASFTCEAGDDGTTVVHRESFGFKPAPVRWAIEAYLRRWLQADIEAEVARLKAQIEAAA